jgi:rhodanese-related sulfurtransferase
MTTKVIAEELKRKLDAGEKVTVIDSRAEQVWDQADTKAGGALRVPPDEAEKHIADLSRDDYIVIYCT